jgi:hypothetical protein
MMDRGMELEGRDMREEQLSKRPMVEDTNTKEEELLLKRPEVEGRDTKDTYMEEDGRDIEEGMQMLKECTWPW